MDTDTVSLPFRTPLFARDPLSFCRRRRHRRRSASLVVISLSLSLSPIASVSAKKKPGKRGRGEQERGDHSWESGVGGGGERNHG